MAAEQHLVQHQFHLLAQAQRACGARLPQRERERLVLPGVGACDRPRRCAKPLAATLVLGCSAAQAHLEATGMGPVYDGVLHFLTSPEDLVPALALALLAGLRGAEHGRRALFTLPLAWLLGSLAGLNAAAGSAGTLGAALWFIVMGALVLAEARLSLAATTALAALLGLFHGVLNGSGLGLSLPAIIATLGVAAAVFVMVALVAAFIVWLRAPWARIAVRVVGSWIAASGLLMVGWVIRGM
jgi:hydrogenase/urease accessory protein HupE